MVGLVYSGCQDPPIARCENLEDKCRKCLHSPGRNYHNSSYVDVYIVCGGSAAKTFLNPCLAGCPVKDTSSNRKKQNQCGYTEYHLSNCSCALELTGSFAVTKGKCKMEKCEKHYKFFVFVLIIFPCFLTSGPLGVSRYLTLLRIEFNNLDVQCSLIFTIIRVYEDSIINGCLNIACPPEIWTFVFKIFTI